jgi:8-oxo-dGTP pyrophosphatase MutT (NUDIX family)
MDGIERLLQSAYNADSHGFLPFLVGAEVVGWLRPAFAQALARFPNVFRHDDTGAVHLHARLNSPEARSWAVAEVVRELARTGVITGWRDELYSIRRGLEQSDVPLLTIERAAGRAFGITSHAVHVNGVVATDAGPAMWIARRSLSKPIDPGMLDNMIGGGLAAGFSVRETLVKEAWEEAGLTPEQVTAASAGRQLRIRREVPEGLQAEVIFVHDLVLPLDVVPHNRDGEVSEFRRLPVSAVVALLREGGQITPDASLVILDWLDRRGILPLPDSAPARAIFSGGLHTVSNPKPIPIPSTSG